MSVEKNFKNMFLLKFSYNDDVFLGTLLKYKHLNIKALLYMKAPTQTNLIKSFWSIGKNVFQSANGISTAYLLMSFLKHFFWKRIFDAIYLSKTYFHSSTPTIDDKLWFLWYTLNPCDHPSNTKRGGSLYITAVLYC